MASWVDLDLVYGKVKFSPLGFEIWGGLKKMHFSGAVVLLLLCSLIFLVTMAKCRLFVICQDFQRTSPLNIMG